LSDPNHRRQSLLPEIERSRLLHLLFGTSDETKMVDHYGGAVASASAAARKRLLEVIRPRWTGLADGRLEIKAPFESREWMWVEVLRWNGDRIEGVLDSVPSLVPAEASGRRCRRQHHRRPPPSIV